jgi:hypothetical protein
MDTLINNKEFLLAYRSLIQVRLRLVTKNGKSPWSRINSTGVTVGTKPPKMPTPIGKINRVFDVVEVNWKSRTTDK